MTAGMMDDLMPRPRRRKWDPFFRGLRVATGIATIAGVLAAGLGFMRPSIATYFGWEAREDAKNTHAAIREDIGKLRTDMNDMTAKILEAVQKGATNEARK
jgi:hypothetical protein